MLTVFLKYALSDAGKRTVDEISYFADTMLQLAERQDELSVANQDKDRAVEQESVIFNSHWIDYTVKS